MSRRPGQIVFSSDGKGMLRKDGGINVLHLQGGEEQMARQHGQLLDAEIRRGVLPFMAGLFGLYLQDGSKGLKAVTAGIARSVLEGLCLITARNMEREYRKVFHAMASAAGVDTRTADLAMGAPDVLLILHAYAEWLLKKVELPALLRPRHPAFGCCGAVALPETTADGHLLHARNMDYDGFGYWDRYPTVAFCRPESGQPFVWVGSAGVHTAALTGMNASGLFLGSNTAPTRDVSLRGTPFFALNERVIREAENLDQAVEIFSQMRPASGYNVHLSHGPSGQAAVVEYAHSRQRVRRPENGLLAATNHYLHPDMAETIPDLSLVDSANTQARYNRIRALLEKGRGEITISHMVGCVRDVTEHSTGKLRPVGDCVCNYTNLSSVVADVTDGIFYVASGRAPAAQSRYIPFDFKQEFENFSKPRAYSIAPIEESPFTHTLGMRCVRHYQRAHAELVRRNDADSAFEHLLKARKAFPADPRTLMSLSLVALKLNLVDQSRTFARKYLESAPPEDPRRYRAHLVLAWCAELGQDWARARAHHGDAAREARDSGEAALEIRAFTSRPFTHRDRLKMHIDLFSSKRMVL